MNPLLRTQRDHGEIFKGSLESILRSRDVVYHGSPKLFSVIKGGFTKNYTGDKGKVFVTPHPAIATCFIIDKNVILRQLEEQGINTDGIQILYDVWSLPVDQLHFIPRRVKVFVDAPGVEEFRGRSSGYIYSIDLGRYSSRTEEPSVDGDEDIELVIESDVIPKNITAISVNWTCSSLVYDPPESISDLENKGLEIVLDDPLQEWRAMNQVELVHDTGDLAELNRMWANWKVMPEDLQRASDGFLKDYLGRTNEEHFESLTTVYGFPDSVASILRALQEIPYGALLSDGTAVVGQEKLKSAGWSKILVQDPASLLNIKVGMCHDMSICLDEILSRSEVKHHCIYVESGESSELKTHSWVVAREDSGAWRVLDPFSSKNCLFGGKFDSPGSAAASRAREWARENNLQGQELLLYSGSSLPSGGASLEQFIGSCRRGLKKSRIKV